MPKDILELLEPSSSLPTELPSGFSDMSLKPTLAPKGRELEEYRVRYAALQAGIDPDIAAAVALQESGFNPSAVSKTGVKGTMQVTKNTGKGLGFDRDNSDENVLAGIALLKQGMEQHPNDIKKALSIYPDPKDTKYWTNSVLGHSIRAKEARKLQNKTIDDLLAEVPEDVFDVPPDTPLNDPESPTLNDPMLLEGQVPPQGEIVDPEASGEESTIDKILNYLTTRPTDEHGNPREMYGILGMPMQVTSPGESLAFGAQAGSMGIAGPATKAIASGATKIPGVSAAISKFPWLAKALNIGSQSVYGAGSGAAISTIGGHPEDADTAAVIGGMTPVVMNAVASGFKATANKLGDMKLGRGITKWVNNKFGFAKSTKDLANKNQVAYKQTEQALQSELQKYAANEIPVDDILDKRTLGSLIKDSIDDRAPQEVVDRLKKIAIKFNKTGSLNPEELNIVKRALYTDAYTAAGKMRGSAYAKNTAKLAKEVKGRIEMGTSPGNVDYFVPQNKAPDAFAANMIESQAKTGGATYFPGKNAYLSPGDSGFMVSEQGGQVINGKPDPNTLNRFVTENASKFADPNKAVGTWESGGKTYIDISNKVATRKDAMIQAMRNNQEAIYNIRSGQSEPTVFYLDHYSKQPGLKTIDPTFEGTGLKGAERLRRDGFKDLYPNRSSFYYTGEKPEPGLGNIKYTVQVPKERLYDYEGDPLNLYSKALAGGGGSQPKNITAYEKAIKDAGFDGLYVDSAKQVRMFKPVSTTPLPEPKEVASSANSVVKELNQEESKHILLAHTLDKEMAKKPSMWSFMTKTIPAATTGGIVSSVAGPVAGTLAGAGMVAGQTVPGFTGLGAAGKAMENPDVVRALSILLPEWLK